MSYWKFSFCCKVSHSLEYNSFSLEALWGPRGTPNLWLFLSYPRPPDRVIWTPELLIPTEPFLTPPNCKYPSTSMSSERTGEDRPTYKIGTTYSVTAITLPQNSSNIGRTRSSFICVTLTLLKVKVTISADSPYISLLVFHVWIGLFEKSMRCTLNNTIRKTCEFEVLCKQNDVGHSDAFLYIMTTGMFLSPKDPSRIPKIETPCNMDNASILTIFVIQRQFRWPWTCADVHDLELFEYQIWNGQVEY